jgi:hypothetical protein
MINAIENGIRQMGSICIRSYHISLLLLKNISSGAYINSIKHMAADINKDTGSESFSLPDLRLLTTFIDEILLQNKKNIKDIIAIHTILVNK